MQAANERSGFTGTTSGTIPSPNEFGVVLVSRHCGDHDGLQLIFEPERIVNQHEVHRWTGVHFPVGLGSQGVLVLRWDLRACTKRLLYRNKVSIGTDNAMRACAHVDLFKPTLLNEEYRHVRDIAFTARSWQEYHTLRGLILLV